MSFIGIWHWTYGKDPFRYQERKPVAAIAWATLISSKGCLYASSHRIVYTMAFVTPVMEHWLEQEIAQWVHHEGWFLYIFCLAI